VERPLDRL